MRIGVAFALRLVSLFALAPASMSSAQADTIVATFSGIVTGGVNGGFQLNGQDYLDRSLAGDPFISTYTFNTEFGVLSVPTFGSTELDGGLILATFSIPGIFSFSLIRGTTPSVIIWKDDLSSVQAIAGAGEFFSIDSGLFHDLFSTDNGFFQVRHMPWTPLWQTAH